MNCEVLWLRPSTGENVSTRRERIAEHMQDRGVNVDLVNASGLDSFSAILRALMSDYDIIIGNVRIGLYLGYVLAIILRTPFIGDVSDPIDQIDSLPRPLFRAFEMLEWWILERCEVSFYVESESYETAKQRGVTAVWAPNSVNYAEFAEPDDAVVTEARRILAQADVDLDKHLAVYAGTLTKGVHIPEIVEAASLNNEWEFILLGEQRQADFRDLIEQVINVKFLGSFPHRFIPGFLSHASVGIALVDVEQPQKMLEYGAAGLVTLAYQGRLRRKFSDKQVYFVEASADSINATLNEIMRNTVDAKRRAEQLSDYAREYSWKSIAKKYYQEINRLS